METKKHAILEAFPANDIIDEHLTELAINGYTVIDSGLNKDELSLIKEKMDLVYQDQVEEAGGLNNIRKLKDENIARALLSYDEIFLKSIMMNSVQSLFKRIFDRGFILISQNGIMNPPEKDFYITHWHRDLNYQHWTSSKPLAITAMLCVTDFDEKTGATCVIPGSHLVSAFPTDKFVNKHQLQVKASAGSFIVFDGMMFHRSGVNISAEKRYGIANLVGVPFLAQQIALPSLLKTKGFEQPLDDHTANFLGYRWCTAESPLDWRMKRIK